MEIIWDNNKLGGDSLVIKSKDKCLKFYDAEKYSIEDLEFYQDCQSRLSGFTLIHYDGLKIGIEKKVHIIQVDFLSLLKRNYHATDIKTRKSIIVSEVDFVEGKTLSEVIGYGEHSNGFLYNIVSLLNKIQEDISKQLGVNMSTDKIYRNFTLMEFQINPYNIKVVKLDMKKHYMKLVITDIAMMIKIFIERNKGIAKSIV